MLSFVFFILALATAATGFFLLPPGIQQVAAFVVAALFLVLFVSGMVRRSNTRSWRGVR